MAAELSTEEVVLPITDLAGDNPDVVDVDSDRPVAPTPAQMAAFQRAQYAVFARNTYKRASLEFDLSFPSRSHVSGLVPLSLPPVLARQVVVDEARPLCLGNPIEQLQVGWMIPIRGRTVRQLDWIQAKRAVLGATLGEHAATSGYTPMSGEAALERLRKLGFRYVPVLGTTVTRRPLPTAKGKLS